MPGRKYDWDSIGNEYICGPDEVTQAFLCEKYGCATVTIANRASKEDWTGRRIEYRNKVNMKIQKKAITQEAELRSRHIKVAKLMMRKAYRKLLKVLPDDFEMNELRLWMKDASDIERKAAGIPDVIRYEDMTDEELLDEIRAKIADLQGS